MKIIPKFSRIARKAGGLFVGLWVSAPASIAELEDPPRVEKPTVWPRDFPQHREVIYQQSTLRVGMLAWRLDFDIQWGRRYVGFQENEHPRRR